MRSYRYLILALALIFCLHAVTAAPAPAPTTAPDVTRRQDDTPSESSQESTPTEASPSTSSSTPRPSPTSSSERSSTTPPSLVPSESHSENSATTTSNNGQPSPSSSAEANAGPQLPIHPKITPAFGLAGAIMLISGLVYCVIGIKNQWLYVFASAAYLSSLAVTVLIVYLMNPPVSNAVQGGFFVAATVTGLIFGGLALVFSDITDGLGCLLGGFCLSMWLLSLKEGSIIPSTGGRAIFIGCMSAAGYALSWSHYTRNYGLIASIAFSGATITMLGVDCFSGAGWKEFWLYIWNLNPDTFPLDTNTYPLTKGMKAEFAGVVILTILGIISQLRLWKLIQEHRAQTAQQRVQKQQARDQEDEERGRSLEDNFQKERAQWEAAYGNKSDQEPAVDSVVGTPKTTKGSFTSVTVEPIPLPKNELTDFHGPESDADKDAITSTRIDSSHQANTRTHTMNSGRPSSDVMAFSRNVSVRSLKPSSPPPVVVVPLPFKIPQEEDADSPVSANASVSAVFDVGEAPMNERSSVVRPLSSTSAMKHLSGVSEARSGLAPHIEDDRASSVAATMDEVDNISLQDLSPPHSPMLSELDLEKEQIPSEEISADIGNNATSGDLATTDAPTTEAAGSSAIVEKSNIAEVASMPVTAGPRQSLTVSTDPKRASSQSLRPRSDTVVESVATSQQPEPASSVPPSSSSQTEQSFNGALAGPLSKVAQSYRTNEWAKHLEAAETPDLDEIPEPSSPGIAIHHEIPAPVSEELKQPLTTTKRSSNRISSDGPVYQNGVFVRNNSSTSRLSQNNVQPMSRNTSVHAAGKVSRTPSAVQLPTVVEPSNNKRVSSGQSPAPNNTLLGQRESLLERRTSSQSFLQPPPASSLGRSGEDMTLSARKRALQQHKGPRPPSASQKWQNKSSSGWAGGNQVPGFDSHQPRRSHTAGSDQKREVLLADWRESIRHDGTPVQSAAMVAEEQRRAVLNAKRQKEMEQQHQAMVAQQRDSMRQSMMRNSGMQDAHREAMRKLQAAASKGS